MTDKHRPYDEDIEANPTELQSVFWTGILMLTVALGAVGLLGVGVAMIV